MDLIPEKKSIPKQRLVDYHVVIFGERGVGKTTLGAQFPDAMIAATEPGTEAISAYDVKVANKAKRYNIHPWEALKKLVDDFVSGGHGFQTLVFDTEDKVYDWCLDWITEQLGAHPSEMDDYGASWNKLNKEFESLHNKVKQSEYGLVSISHAQYKEIEDIRGKKRDKLIPSVGGSAGTWLLDDADIIVLYDMDRDNNRVMRLDTTKDFEAKQRIRTLSGEISGGDSAEEAYNNFKEEFDTAIEKLNEEEGVTEKDIKEFYDELEQEREEMSKPSKQEMISKVADKCKEVGINSKKLNEMVKDNFDIESFKDLTIEQSKEILKDLENQ